MHVKQPIRRSPRLSILMRPCPQLLQRSMWAILKPRLLRPAPFSCLPRFLLIGNIAWSGGLITPLGNLTKKHRWRVPHRRFRSTGTGRKPRVSLRRGFFLLTCLDAQGDRPRIGVICATSATSDTTWGRKVRRKRRTRCCDGTLGKSFRSRPGRNSTDS